MKKTPKIRLYVKQDLDKGNFSDLEKDQAHYLKNVMRKKISEQILVFNGRDGEWLAEIVDINNKGGDLNLLEQTKEQVEIPDIWLIFAKVKRNPTEFIAQKATELGVTKLLPVFTENSEAKSVNIERLRQIVTEAAEQCERVCVPEIEGAKKLTDLLNGWNEERKIVMCDESGGGEPMLDTLKGYGKDEKWAILIGPEGGFSKTELENLRELPFIVPVGLGPRILKAETAAISALTCWQSALGDWQKKPNFKPEN